MFCYRFHLKWWTENKSQWKKNFKMSLLNCCRLWCVDVYSMIQMDFRFVPRNFAFEVFLLTTIIIVMICYFTVRTFTIPIASPPIINIIVYITFYALHGIATVSYSYSIECIVVFSIHATEIRWPLIEYFFKFVFYFQTLLRQE